ncbi:D-aminoacyl-tRNA deacylase [Phytoactinopolyspora mesophila]|uniref:D-aminoacyl-tRNA deacylase n=1 Tax=Phytoactinopolyspora mesophila TaxID=2650750 RepID=A0A7K3M534_9ACTN|nr:D-aminoacyl-tRNA deacylase [Phytoactinopolyspora mesophila]NDL58419.1 D-tyrosyl-tRNA(Tyr) deacylase [Phytoactinopolyspora mesophila]
MRAVVQRVTSASVRVGGEVAGAIYPGSEPGGPDPAAGAAGASGQGLLVLLGVTHDDDEETAAKLARKVWDLRILDGEKSASDVSAPILVVSQFTLYADTRKGRRPSWSAAAPGSVSEPLVTAFAAALGKLGAKVETGVFGADMKVSLVNDGPVTLILDA